MDPLLMKAITVGASLGGGAAVKALSKKQGKVYHKLLAPLTAAAVAIGVEALTGQAFDLETITGGTSAGALAVLIHSIWRGGKVEVKGRFKF